MINIIFLLRSVFFSFFSKNIGMFSIAINSKINKTAKVYKFVTLRNVFIDDMSYVANFARISNCKIGKFTSIAPSVVIGLGMHPAGWVSTHPAFYSLKRQSMLTYVKTQNFLESKPINIGSDVWIGHSVLILDGVSIGDGAIVAAGSFVISDIPPYAIYGGVPAKLIRYRFQSSEIAYLLKIKWWDMDDRWIKANAKNFNNLENFKNHLDEHE